MTGDRLTISCPLCGHQEDVGFSALSKLIHTAGNGRKGFLTADVGVGGIEHTCGPPVEKRKLRAEDW